MALDNNQIENSNISDDEISLKELLIKVKDWYTFLLSKWKIILIAGIIGGLMGFIYAKLDKPNYKAILTFAMEEGGGGGGGGLSGALGLVVSFSIWGVVQERILTQQYDDEFFTYSYGLVFLNRLGGLILSAYLMHFFKVQYINSALWEYSFPSVANMLSSWCQYEALKYVSFPTAMLAKAFKVMPVMIMGVFMHNKTYESYEYLSAALVGFGLYLFMDSSEHINFKENVFGQTESTDGAICGVVLLILFLFFDSFTGQWQTRMFQINKSMSPLQMMLIMNAFSCVFSFITLVHQEELTIALQFIYKHPEIIIHLIIFCITSTVGQLFIFYTVKNFGAVVFSIIMSLRILFSTILSCVIYSHPITELGFLGIAIVFGAITYRIRRKTEGKPLIRWRETEDGKRDIMHEWHEHLDV